MKHSVKIISAIAILTVLIIGTSLIAHGVLEKSSMELQKNISAVEGATTAEDWKKAENNLEQTRSKWAGVNGTWSMLVDHQEIDNIEFTLSRMEKFILTRDKASALAETSALMNYVKHIPLKESLNLKNVL
jgi:hypothetical protein